MDGGDSFDYLSAIYFIFRIGPGIGVGVDQELRVGAGFGTDLTRFRTPDAYDATAPNAKHKNVFHVRQRTLGCLLLLHFPISRRVQH